MHNTINIEQLIELRHRLHREPELSGNEKHTAQTVLQFLKQQHPDLLVSAVGGHGIIAIYRGDLPGRTVLLRCDMDALPIGENIDIPYGSNTTGVSHKCGHDGHMAIMCGVAAGLATNKITRGTVILLFQPAEETGQGAVRVISQLNCKPDLCYALHNLPGFSMGAVITKKGSFAAASKGMIIKLSGKTSHAAHPENGISPAPAVASLISWFSRISKNSRGIAATLIHVTIGKIAFGTSPGDATVMVTLRAPDSETMRDLAQKIIRQISTTATEEHLQYSIEWTEEFPATANAELPVSIIQSSADKLKLKTLILKKSFPWSEDFGHFTEKYPGALFGLGAGESTPPLHTHDYDFPDQLIPTGIAIFKEIIEKSLNQ